MTESCTTGRTRMTGKRQARRLVPALLVVLSLLVLAACGQNNRNSAAPVDKAAAGRAYAQCIRDNGVPDFPDPDANGQLRGPAHEKEGDPKFRAAMETCRQKLPGGGDHR